LYSWGTRVVTGGAILGPRACGKTTTLRMIAGFERPDAGRVVLNGENMEQSPPNKRPVNTVLQNYALFPHLNVFDNVAFGLRRLRLGKEEITRRAGEALELVMLKKFEQRLALVSVDAQGMARRRPHRRLPAVGLRVSETWAFSSYWLQTSLP
jgi:ABC-type Fe3+/spermidine/putrescine transport system ATPase subunit